MTNRAGQKHPSAPFPTCGPAFPAPGPSCSCGTAARAAPPPCCIWSVSAPSRSKHSFGLETDPACLLDLCDLVFLDPVGVGYSRLLNPQKAEKYFCTDGDARSTAFAVTHWLRRHSRWDSPLYLCGESYGTVRACRVLAELGRSPVSESRMVLGVPVAGVILIGLATSIGARGGELTEPGLSLTSAALPSMAAVHWYHNLRGRGQAALEDCVAQAWRFAKDELAPALFEGDDCPESAVRRLSARLADLTGMEEAYFVQNRLLLRSMEDFMTQVIRQKGQRVDLYDARMAFSVSQPYNAIGDANVPLAVMNGLLAPRLGVQTYRLYYTGNLTVHPGWKYETEDLGERTKTHLGCLRAAMQANPHMRVLAASGLYDLCTLAGNTRYALSHSGIPKDRLTAREYPGGHGVYSSAEGKSAFLQDVRALIAPQNR